jgi:hypothetical protein
MGSAVCDRGHYNYAWRTCVRQAVIELVEIEGPETFLHMWAGQKSEGRDRIVKAARQLIKASLF